MTSKQTKQRVEKLAELIAYHQKAYHGLDKPEISDEAYDSLVRELEELGGGDVLERIGSEPLKKFKKVSHKVVQWSFNDAFNEEDIRAFDVRIKSFLARRNFSEGGLKNSASSADEAFQPHYVCELKIDGLKIVLEYEKGNLKTAATRGDGKVGEDVTGNVKTIKSVPLQLNKKVDIIVEGEIFLPISQFERINREQKKKGEETFANPRNFAAGTMRQLDPKMVAERKLEVFVYDIAKITPPAPPYIKGGQNSIVTQEEELNFLRELGFKVNKNFKICQNIKEVIEYWKFWEIKKNKQDYLIDGVVVKVNENKYQEALGYTGKAPRFGIAFKFQAEQVTTIVEDIVLQIGRMGTLTPVAHLKPVVVAGSTVSRATLHNEDEIKKLDVRIGDTVILQKAGDVIPDIVSVIKELRTGKEREFIWPKRVTECGGGGEIERIPGEVAWRCKNKNSFSQIKRRFYHFTGKHAFDIDGLGPKIVDALLDAELISTYDDIFTLKKGDLLALPRFAEKSVDNLLSAIEKTKNISLARFIISLSIGQVGEETAILLAQNFQNIEKLKEAKKERLEEIEGVGPIVAESIVSWFKDKENKKQLDRLLRYIAVSSDSRLAVSDSKLAHKTFVLTGILSGMSRDEAKQKIRSLGGSVSSSVSKETSYIVTGKNPGSKYEKALELGVQILTENEFQKLTK